MNSELKNRRGTSSLLLTLLMCATIAADVPEGKIFSSAYIKNTMLKVTKWQLAHPKWPLYDWTNGALYAGIFAAYKATGDKGFYDELLTMGNSNDWKPGPDIFNADDYAICQTYVDLYRLTGDQRMVDFTIKNTEKFMTTSYPSNDNIRKIPWWWCDALFMAPPLMVKLGVSLNENKYLRFSDSLYHQTYDLLYDKQENLFSRDLNYLFDEGGNRKKESNGKNIFWSRGNGWVLAGLARILNELPADYPERGFYEKIFKEMSAKIASIQRPDGLWRASLLDPDSYPGGEASGSGFYCYALAWGINNGLLDNTVYLKVVEKAWKGLTGLVHNDGMVGWVQPVAADPRTNFSPESWEVFGTGAFLLAGSEVIKMSKK
jgi:unsaturated rhamnogalacturonyl hydrolase